MTPTLLANFKPTYIRMLEDHEVEIEEEPADAFADLFNSKRAAPGGEGNGDRKRMTSTMTTTPLVNLSRRSTLRLRDWGGH